MRATRGFYATCVAIGVLLAVLWGGPLLERGLAGENDFLQLYSGARLVGTSHLYDIEASKRISREAVGTYYEAVYFTRLPFYALLLKPLGWLPYPAAYWSFQALSLALFAAFCYGYIRLYPELAIFVAVSVPMLINFANGQDSGMVTALAGLSLLWIRRGEEFRGGLLMSLCSIKFHLLALVPLALVIHRRWRILKGGLAGGLILLAASTAAAGWQWPLEFLQTVRNPELHPGPDHMTTVRALVYGLLGREERLLEIALTAAVAALFCYLAWKIRSFDVVFGLALAGGLLVCWHAYSQDLVLLLLVVGVFGTSPAPKAVRGAAMIAALPPTTFLLFHGAPYSIAVPLLLLSILLAALIGEDDGKNRGSAGIEAT